MNFLGLFALTACQASNYQISVGISNLSFELLRVRSSLAEPWALRMPVLAWQPRSSQFDLTSICLARLARYPQDQLSVFVAQIDQHQPPAVSFYLAAAGLGEELPT